MSLTRKIVLKTLETGLIPEKVIRAWVRYLCRQACQRASLGDIEARHAVYRQIIKDLKKDINLKFKAVLDEQLADMNAEFFELFLGKRLLHSSSYFPTGAEHLEEAEETMLWMTADRARIRDGMKILELGCGWGSMSFWLARQYPEVKITAVTDLVAKQIYLQKKINEQNLENIEVLTCDFADLEFKADFDRIISVGRFDFVAGDSNWQDKCSSWLKHDGMLFLQTTAHDEFAYYLETVGLKHVPGNVVARNKLCLSADMPLNFQKKLAIVDFWKISGDHFKKTAEKWLARFYYNRQTILPVLEKSCGKKMAWTWFQRWRLYLLSISEQFGFNRGQSWITCQYLYKKK
jgi:cyclopropane-fatty-acyl-phospholipid synthase